MCTFRNQPNAMPCRMRCPAQCERQTQSTGLRYILPSFLWRKVPDSGARSVCVKDCPRRPQVLFPYCTCLQFLLGPTVIVLRTSPEVRTHLQFSLGPTVLVLRTSPEVRTHLQFSLGPTVLVLRTSPEVRTQAVFKKPVLPASHTCLHNTQRVSWAVRVISTL